MGIKDSFPQTSSLKALAVRGKLKLSPQCTWILRRSDSQLCYSASKTSRVVHDVTLWGGGGFTFTLFWRCV